MSVLRARADDAAPGHDEAAGLWRRIAGDARALASTEPWLRRRMHALLAAGTPERMLVQVLSRRLATLDWPEPDLRALLTEVLDAAPELVQLAARDLGAVTERDPACAGPLHVLLNLKGFHACRCTGRPTGCGSRGGGTWRTRCRTPWPPCWRSTSTRPRASAAA
jgi:serine O-acetyltransferase